jgi:hypothetical protein
MAKLVLLWPAGSAVRFGEAEAGGLARLGVTRLGLLRGDGTIGVVMDGWAFDPARHAEAAGAVLSQERPLGRLLPVAEIGVSGVVQEGEPE